MGKQNFWLNKAGDFAKFGSAIEQPKYGMSMDVATADWGSQGDFNALISSSQDTINAEILKIADDLGFGEADSAENKQAQRKLTALMPYGSVSHKELTAAVRTGMENYAQQQADDQGNWLTDAIGGVSDFVGGAKDRIEGLVKDVPGGDQAWDAADTVLTGKYSPVAIAVTRPIKATMYASAKANEYGATAIEATGVASKHGNLGEQFLNLFHGDTWDQAHEIVTRNHLSLGDTLVAMDYDLGQQVRGNSGNQLLSDGQRLRSMLDSSGAGTAASLVAELAATWYADPVVLAGRGAGLVMASRRGEIMGSAAAQRAQRDIISAPTREEAEQLASTAKLGSARKAKSLTLWDRLEDIRNIGVAARNGDSDMSYADFLRTKTFANNINGETMGALIAEANDQEWPLLKRWLLQGDEDTHQMLLQGRGEVSSKIQALEQVELKGAKEDLDTLVARRDAINARSKPTADVAAPLGAYIRPGGEAERRLFATDTDWLDEPIEQAQAKVDDLKKQLSTFNTHDDWYNRVLAGVEQGDDLVSSGGRTNTMMNSLDTISKPDALSFGAQSSKLTQKAFARNEKWLSENPSVYSWRHDWLSPESFFLRVPRSWFLNSNHMVNFHEQNKSLNALSSWIDTFETLTGRRDPLRRSQILDRYAGLVDEPDKTAYLNKLEEEFSVAIGRKYGLNDDMLRMLLAGDGGGWQGIIANHSAGWRRLTTASLKEHEMPNGDLSSILEFVSNNGLVRAHVPLGTAELQNSHKMLNLTDLDYAIRRHKDILQNMSESHDWQTRLYGKAIAARRNSVDFAVGAMEMFNGLWKPLALISLRWPLRVIGDENTRWALLGLGGMVREAYHGFFNMAYNRGVWAYEKLGRKNTWVKQTRLSDDAVGTPREVDAFDVKAASNPSAAIPLEVADLDHFDELRFNELAKTQLQRKLAHREQVRHRAAGEELPRSGSEQRWNDRMDEIESSHGGGHMIDPLTEKSFRKGYATSVYPGRMVTLDKPTFQDFRHFVDQNSDVLANKRNRVGVWFDRDFGRWTLDVVRPHHDMDSALNEAANAGVDHVFDVGDGWQRMVWEDDPLGNWRTTMAAPEFGIAPKLQKRKSGVGEIKVRTLDGKTVKATHIYGPDPLNGNIAIEQTKSINAVEGYFGSNTRMGDQMRAGGLMADYETVQPEDRRWAGALADYANKYVRKDSVWRKMLNGQTDAQLRGWLKSSEGRIYRDRIGHTAISNPDAFIAEKRQEFESLLPGGAIQSKLRDTNITGEDAAKLIPQHLRKQVQGAKITHLTGNNAVTQNWNRLVQWSYKHLGSKMSDAVTRHPMGAALYRTKLLNLVSRYEGSELTPAVFHGLQAQATNFAVGQIRKYLFNMADEWNGIRAFRFMAPFLNAQVEVMDRYLKLIGSKPESLGRLLGVANVTGGDNGPLMQTVDENGLPTDKWDPNGYVVTQLPMPILKKLGLDKVYKDFPIPTSSINLILQGGTSDLGGWSYLVPSFGPLVTIPASGIVGLRDQPEDRAKWWYKELFPFGQPRDTIDALLPAWARRFRTVFFDKGGDPAYGTEVYQAWATLYADWEKGGRKGPAPTQKDADHFAEMMYAVRGIAGFVAPVPFNPNPKYQFYIDQYRKFLDQDPTSADKKFYNKYGPEMYRFAASTTKLNMDLPPNELAAQAYTKYKGTMQENPLLAGVIAGPGVQNGEYNFDIYRWQLGEAVAPGASANIREKLSPDQIIRENNIDRGWIQYNKLMAMVDTQMLKAGLVTLPEIKQEAKDSFGTVNKETMEAARESLLDQALGSATPYASELRAWRDQKIKEIAQYNEGWEDAYRSRSTQMGEWLTQARRVVADPQFKDRIDIQGLRDYLRIRDAVTTELDTRQQMGGSSSITAEQNVDLAQWWYMKVRSLVNNNLLFGEVYHRYLENDDLESARF